MREDFLIKNFPRSPILEEEFNSQKEKIFDFFKKIRNTEALHISCHMEKNPHKEEYFCWINFYLPRKVLHVKEKGSDALVSLKKAFNTLKNNVRKYKEKYLRKKRNAKRS